MVKDLTINLLVREINDVAKQIQDAKLRVKTLEALLDIKNKELIEILKRNQ